MAKSRTRVRGAALLAAFLAFAAGACEGDSGGAEDGGGGPPDAAVTADTPGPPADVAEVPAPALTLANYPRVDGSTSNIPSRVSSPASCWACRGSGTSSR
jgi:hypothetical protein